MCYVWFSIQIIMEAGKLLQLSTLDLRKIGEEQKHYVTTTWYLEGTMKVETDLDKNLNLALCWLQWDPGQVNISKPQVFHFIENISIMTTWNCVCKATSTFLIHQFWLKS